MISKVEFLSHVSTLVASLSEALTLATSRAASALSSLSGYFIDAVLYCHVVPATNMSVFHHLRGPLCFTPDSRGFGFRFGLFRVAQKNVYALPHPSFDHVFSASFGDQKTASSAKLSDKIKNIIIVLPNQSQSLLRPAVLPHGNVDLHRQSHHSERQLAH